VFDTLVIGGGPAGLIMAAALCDQGLTVQGVSPVMPTVAAWPNTYGIWCDELMPLGLEDLTGHQWQDSVAYFGSQASSLNRQYGLLDKEKLLSYLLDRGSSVDWHQGSAGHIEHNETGSSVTTQGGEVLKARVIIDASGHQPVFIQRPAKTNVAYQAAYGMVATFSAPPIQPGRFVLMDYRDDHLSPIERLAPPTFLYAMDFGENVFFLEETSLAYAPAVPYTVLKQRLYQRLAFRGIEVKEIHHVEHCLFPMNLPLPDLTQPVIGFGGAASMVHPATGYMVGALLRRAPLLAVAIATALGNATNPSPETIARAGWQALWPQERVRKHYIYSFGLETLMRFDQPHLCRFFNTFFQLPQPQWSGFLADTLSTPALIMAMINLFGQAPNAVRGGLIRSVGTDGSLLWNAISA
jgi:lycopene cyclase-like protein